MPADRLLGTLLRALQTHTNQQDTPRLLGTAASLFTTLNNPLNVTLLTSQVLSAPAIWTQPDGLQTCMRCLSVYHSAAQALIRYENVLNGFAPETDSVRLQPERTLTKDDWIRAALSGADKHSPRWRDLLVIGGLLLGFGPFEDENLSRDMRVLLEKALVTATNVSLEKTREDEPLGLETVTLVLNHCFPILSNYQRSALKWDLLLPVLVRSTLHSPEGLRSGYFLGAIELDVQILPGDRLMWPQQSPSYQRIQMMLSNPLVTSLGPLSRLIAHAVESVKNPRLVTATLDDLEYFARALNTQWRQQRLSNVEVSQQNLCLDDMTAATTLPALFKLLQSAMFASVIVLRSIISRTLGDSALARNRVAPNIAEQTLLTLRSLYFVTARQGSASFSQYSFVYFTAMDILSAYSRQVKSFLLVIKPSNLGSINTHALERNLDLFFLNTAEHFTLNLSPRITKELLIPAVTSYLMASGDKALLLLFEAAHSVTLAVFSAPQNTDVTIEYLPIYVDLLFKAFPANVSARQFRLAFKALLKITSPPSKLAKLQPLMPATLLELLHDKAQRASTVPIPEGPGSAEAALEKPPVSLSEQAILVLTMLDTFTQIPLDILDEWLPVAADMVHEIEDPHAREYCKEHFWQTLVGGEMDPERSRLCHAWWSTGGGKEWVLYGRQEELAMMSGALPAEAPGSKL